MASLTAHSEARLAVVCQELGVQAKTVAALKRRLERTELDGNAALCYATERKASVSDRDQWKPSDVMALIVRGGRCVTVLATRKSQVNLSHLRVEQIVWLS